MRNRAGWEVAAAAVAFSQCVCSSDRQTLGAFFFSFPLHLTCHTVQQGAAQPGEVGTAREAHGQSATISWSVRAHGHCVFIRVDGGLTGPGNICSGVLYWRKPCRSYWRRQRNGKNRLHQPTRDVDVHDARASPDAVGGVADVRAGEVVGHGPLEEQSVVLDLHIAGKGAVQAVVREREREREAII